MRRREHVLILMLFAFILFVKPVSAELSITDVVMDPQVLWLDESDTIHFSFVCNECKRAEIRITGPGTDMIDDAELKAGTPNLYQYEYKVDRTGSYTAIIRGYDANETNSTNETLSFSAFRLKADIISPSAIHPLLVYKGQKIESILVEFFLVGDDEQELTGMDMRSVDFELYLNEQKIDLNRRGRYDYDTENGYWKISFQMPDEIAPGVYDLTIKAKYSRRVVTVSRADAIIVKPSLEAEILYPTTNKFISLQGTDKITVKVRVSEKGKPILLGEPVFRFYLGDEEITPLVSQDPDDKFIWYLQMVVPGKEAGTKDITVYVEYNGETSYPTSLVEKDAVHFVIPFKGRITDSTGTVRHIRIKMENSDSSKYYFIENGPDGKYSANIIPGKYDMEIELPELTAIFRDVEITERNLRETSIAGGPINYDAPRNINTIDGGINVVKLVVLEFDLPFSVAELTIPYSDTKLKNEENLEVYWCKSWNFGKVSCSSGWEKVKNFVPNPRGNIVLLNTTHPSAFVIGERKELKIELDRELGYGQYRAGDKLIIKGQVSDEKGKAIEGADIKVTIVGIENISSTAKTIISGNFKTQIELPLAKGIYNISVKASKFPYKDAVKYFTIETEIKKEITFLNVPDGEKIYVGEPKDIKFSLMNTGQTELSDTRLFISGLATEWYQLLPVSVNYLGPGDMKEVELKILVPKGYCKKYECKNYYPVTIQAKNKEIEKEALMTITLRKEREITEEEPQASEPKESANGLEGLFTGIEGGDFENTVMIGGIFMIILLTALSIKKKQTEKLGQHPGFGLRAHPKNQNLLFYMKEGMRASHPHRRNFENIFRRERK